MSVQTDNTNINNSESVSTKLVRSELENTENIKLVDSLIVSENKTLDMFCYTKCDNDEMEYVQRCRGVVFCGNNLVFQGFSYTPEYNETQVDQISKALGPEQDFSKVMFYESMEGAIVRLFYFENRWILSTHRKLDAFKSRWSSRESFGVMFKNAMQSEYDTNKDFMNFIENSKGNNILERFYNNLDKKLSYMFLVANNSENRIVCLEPERPRMYFVGTFDSNFNFCLENHTFITMPKKHNFTSVSELSEFVYKTKPEEIQGVICFLPNNTQVKVLNSVYQKYFSVRNNEASLKFRYLQVRNDQELREMMYELYPRYSSDFVNYEHHIENICTNIYNYYVSRFINGNFITVPAEEYEVMQLCHTWHKQDRKNNRISVDKIYEVFNTRRPVSINHMIKREIMEVTKRNIPTSEVAVENVERHENTRRENTRGRAGYRGSSRGRGNTRGRGNHSGSEGQTRTSTYVKRERVLTKTE